MNNFIFWLFAICVVVRIAIVVVIIVAKSLEEAKARLGLWCRLRWGAHKHSLKYSIVIFSEIWIAPIWNYLDHHTRDQSCNKQELHIQYNSFRNRTRALWSVEWCASVKTDEDIYTKTHQRQTNTRTVAVQLSKHALRIYLRTFLNFQIYIISYARVTSRRHINNMQTNAQGLRCVCRTGEKKWIIPTHLFILFAFCVSYSLNGWPSFRLIFCH